MKKLPAMQVISFRITRKQAQRVAEIGRKTPGGKSAVYRRVLDEVIAQGGQGEVMNSFPISANNRMRRMQRLAKMARTHAWTIEVWSAAKSDAFNSNARRHVSLSLRCLSELVRDMRLTNARPVMKGRK